MPRTVETEPLQKHTLQLYQGDFEKLAAYYPKVGATVAVRRIVRTFLLKLDAQVPEPQIEAKDMVI